MIDTVSATLRDHLEGEAFPQSWYPMALAREVGPDDLLGVDFLDTRVIVYRDAQGRPVVQGAYCPHLGADLSQGQLVDGQVRCPFHHWRFDAEGRCVHIPTGDKLPPGALVATYPSAEAWGLIWAFNGTAPLFAPPRMPDADEESLRFVSNVYGPRLIDSWLGRSMSYYAVGVAPGPASEQRLVAIGAMAKRLIDEDAPVLNTMRFRKGMLVASDRFLARYFNYVADFPVASSLSG